MTARSHDAIPCPACPDGNEWAFDGPTAQGAAAMMISNRPQHYDVIDRLAAAAKADIRDRAQAARFELGIPLTFYSRSTSIPLPHRLTCPDCGGPLFASIDEWETADGQPTQDGITVLCVKEWDAIWNDEDDDDHRHYFSDWHSLTRTVTRFLRRRVRFIGSAS